MLGMVDRWRRHKPKLRQGDLLLRIAEPAKVILGLTKRGLRATLRPRRKNLEFLLGAWDTDHILSARAYLHEEIGSHFGREVNPWRGLGSFGSANGPYHNFAAINNFPAAPQTSSLPPSLRPLPLWGPLRGKKRKEPYDCFSCKICPAGPRRAMRQPFCPHPLGGEKDEGRRPRMRGRGGGKSDGRGEGRGEGEGDGSRGDGRVDGSRGDSAWLLCKNSACNGSADVGFLAGRPSMAMVASKDRPRRRVRQ